MREGLDEQSNLVRLLLVQIAGLLQLAKEVKALFPSTGAPHPPVRMHVHTQTHASYRAKCVLSGTTEGVMRSRGRAESQGPVFSMTMELLLIPPSQGSQSASGLSGWATPWMGQFSFS